MKVSEIRNQTNEIIQQYKANEKADAGSDKQVSGNVVPEEKVTLSTKARDVQRVKEAVDKLPDVREEKVQEIKDQIDQGTYSVSGDKIAEKMVGESLLDIIA